VTVFAFGVVGIYAIAAALQGCMENPFGAGARALAFVAGIACLWPGDLRIQIGGALVVLAMLALNLLGRAAATPPRPKDAART